MELSTSRRSPAAAPIARIAALALAVVLGLAGSAPAATITVDTSSSSGDITLGDAGAPSVSFMFEESGVVSATGPSILIQNNVTYAFVIYSGTFASNGGNASASYGVVAPLGPGTSIVAQVEYNGEEGEANVYANGFAVAGPGPNQSAFVGNGDVQLQMSTGWSEPSNWFILNYFRYETGASVPTSAMAAFRLTWLNNGAAAEITLVGTVAGAQYTIPDADADAGVPEPGTVALAGLGAGAAFVGRRRAARG